MYGNNDNIIKYWTSPLKNGGNREKSAHADN